MNEFARIPSVALGPIPTGTPGNLSTQALSSATTYVAISFLASAPQLSSVTIVNAAITGTPGSVALTMEIQSDSSTYLPDGIALASAAVTGVVANSPVTFNSISAHNLTKGTRYWIVIKCTSAPTHYTQVLYGDIVGNTYSGGQQLGLMTKYHTTDGTTWTGGSATSGMMVLDYGSGIVDGNGVIGGGADNTSGKIYTNNSRGTSFIAPWSFEFRRIGVVLRKVGTISSGTISAKIYIGGALICTSYTLPLAGLSTNFTRSELWFADPVRIQEGQEVRIMLDVSAGDSSNYIYSLYFTLNSSYPQLGPFGGTCKQANLVSGNWSFTANSYRSIWIPDARFITAPLNRRKYNNQR